VRTTAPKIIFYTGIEPPETDIMHCLHSAAASYFTVPAAEPEKDRDKT
jgi:hypothetical protein